MTPAQTTILLIYGAILAAWPIRYLVLKYVLSKTQYLSPGSPTLAAADPPLVSAQISGGNLVINAFPSGRDKPIPSGTAFGQTATSQMPVGEQQPTPYGAWSVAWAFSP